MHTNSLVYVRDALVERGYYARVIPWYIPSHERGVIDYDLDLVTRFPRLYSSLPGKLLLIYGLFAWALWNFGVFITPFRTRFLDRTSFLAWFEFQLVHLAGGRVILNPYGGDISYPDVWSNSSDKGLQLLAAAWKRDHQYSVRDTEETKRIIEYGEKYADAIIASLDWPDVLSRITSYGHMRIFPKPPSRCEVSLPVENGLFRIVHATNHPHFKGTHYMQKAVDELNAEGHTCELIIIQGKSNREVLDHMIQAHLVIDQLFVGAYGRQALEAMAVGRPVICYLRENLKALYESWAECPIVNANVDNIKAKILEVMRMPPEERRALGNKGKAYVEKYNSSNYVGGELHKIIQNLY